jgi:hypothetical protein
VACTEGARSASLLSKNRRLSKSKAYQKNKTLFFFFKRLEAPFQNPKGFEVREKHQKNGVFFEERRIGEEFKNQRFFSCAFQKPKVFEQARSELPLNCLLLKQALRLFSSLLFATKIVNFSTP